MYVYVSMFFSLRILKIFCLLLLEHAIYSSFKPADTGSKVKIQYLAKAGCLILTPGLTKVADPTF